MSAFAARILKDWPWKLGSLLLATIVFYSIRQQISATETISVPVVVEARPGIAIESVEPATVHIRLRGSAKRFDQLQRRAIAANISPDFSVTSGSKVKEYSISRRHLQGMEGFQLEDVSPKTVTVRFDRQSTLDLPLDEPILIGKPLRGIARATLSTNVVRVTGSHNTLEELRRAGAHLQTTPIEVEGRTRNFTENVTVLPPPMVVLSEINPRIISATVDILTENIEREFAHIPVRVTQSTDANVRLYADPSYVTLRLTGRTDLLQKITADELAVFAQGLDTNTTLSVCVPHELVIEKILVIPDAIRLLPENPRSSP